MRTFDGYKNKGEKLNEQLLDRNLKIRSVCARLIVTVNKH